MLKVYLLQVTCSSLLLFIPGLAVSRALRIKGVIAWAFAPLISLSISASGAVVANLLGISWGIGSFLLMTAICLVVAYLLALKFQPVHADFPPRWLLPTGIAACLLQILPFYFGARIRDPIQQIDSTFHMNLVWNILDSGNGSTFGGATRMYGLETTKTIYPSGWHDFVSLFATKNTVVTAVNSMHVVVCVLWVVGLTLLAHAVFPNRPEIVLATQVCSTLIVEFPTYLQSAYPVFPNSLAIACLPTLFADCLLLVRSGRQRTLYARTIYGTLITLIVLSSCLVHPSYIFNVCVLGIGPIVFLSWQKLQTVSKEERKKLLWITALFSVFGVIIIIVALLSSSFISNTLYQMATKYTTTSNISLSAFIKILGLASSDPIGASSVLKLIRYPLSLICLVLTVAGFAVCRSFGKPGIAIFWMWVPAALVALSTMWRVFPLSVIGGIWYMSPHRILGVLAIPQTLLMALALVRIVSRIRPGNQMSTVHRARGLNRTAVLAVAIIFAITVPLGLVAKVPYFRMVYDPASRFTTIVASSGELDMLYRLRQEKLDKGLILGDPMNGSALAQAVSGREVVLPQLYYRPSNRDESYLKDNFSDLGHDREVCDVIRKRHIAYFYYDPDLSNMAKNSAKQAPGFYKDINWSGLRKIDSGGTATLYEITACK